ncbi:class I SAM-dependent methyltransferase [Caulobacter sp.]|uniref:class I SAM-dependent methyltransferase n=1 Tax=Caulobacter sp. TaxID=78 RepID=UPI002B4A1DAC|nr:methyltransferase domain-containing protein [Caulobacter sp.]HJV40807.1 methyltransferase domain-containing protein [Caulobacter sp.]
MFPKVTEMVLLHPETTRVVDAGAGAAWCFPTEFKTDANIHLIGIDIDAEEMELNPALDERIESSVCEPFPVQPGTIDAITSNFGVEHFPDNEAFLRNCFDSLRPGGRVIALFPSRYASFAILNRLTPRGLKLTLLKHFRPDVADHTGFTAFYDRTDYGNFTKVVKRVGLEVEFYHPSYFHSYFAFFYPLHLGMILSGALRLMFGARSLATYNLFVLRKPGPRDSLRFGQERHSLGTSRPK